MFTLASPTEKRAANLISNLKNIHKNCDSKHVDTKSVTCKTHMKATQLITDVHPPPGRHPNTQTDVLLEATVV